jgi:hypothetical protein
VTATKNQVAFADDPLSLLAWAGWQLQVPGDWRPLKMSGTPTKGWMIVGDAMCALFSIHWEQPGDDAITNADAWVQQRLKRQGLEADPEPPAAERFSVCTWAHGVQSEEDKQTTYWYGYAEPAKLLVGVKVNGVLPESQRAQVTRQVLPTLRTSAVDTETVWAMHDLSFVAPPGFELAQQHLFVGDVALEFHRGRRETLLLRQVYPGDLALERRPAERWLAAYPFIEHRRLRKSSTTIVPWRHGSRREWSGTRRSGRKRLGFPLGFIAPRWTDAVAVHDQSLGRLLIVEHQSVDRPDGGVCDRAVLQMNQHVQEAS